jgi:predicted RNA-binding Zn-ribbon protein involved in translation (DUF1610 family)
MSRKSFFGAKCPSCKSERTIRNSRARNQKEKIIIAFTWFELYRCKKCGWRGWRANVSFDMRMFKKIIIYILLMLITAFVVGNLLKMVV